MNKIENLTKILLEEKSFNILKVTSENSKTTKEIAKELKISSSNLYYTINKLTNIGALRIVEKKTLGNLIEHKYSSSHIFDNSLIVNNENKESNLEFFIQYYLLSQKKALKLLEEDINNKSKEDSSKLLIKDIKMSKENWDDFQSIINDYLSTLDGEENQLNIQISLSAIVD